MAEGLGGTLDERETGLGHQRDLEHFGQWEKNSISLTDLGLLRTERNFPWSAKLDSQQLGMESPFCKRERGEVESGGSLDLTSVICLHSAETGASRAWPSW